VGKLATEKSSELSKQLERLSVTGDLLGVRTMEISSEINAHPKDSVENRKFIMAVQYLETHRPITDESGQYRSNIAAENSILLICDLSARQYGTPSVSIGCELKK
jgi:hypothetical protein